MLQIRKLSLTELKEVVQIHAVSDRTRLAPRFLGCLACNYNANFSKAKTARLGRESHSHFSKNIEYCLMV